MNPAINTPPAGVTFDSAPVAATTAPPPGVVFDSDPVSGTSSDSQANQPAQQTVTQPSASQPPPAMYATPGSLPGDSIPSKVSLWAQNVQSDLRRGTSITGIGALLKAMGAHGLEYGTTKAVADFIGSPALGTLRAIQGQAEMAQPGQAWKGIKDTVGGAADAATLPSSFIAPEGGELVGQGTDIALTQAERAAKAIGGVVSKPFDTAAVQPRLQAGIRSVFDSVAKDAGVSSPSAVSIRDVASDLSSAIRAKGSALYSQLDAATGGGRFRRFQDALSNIEQGLKDSIGVDPEKFETLTQRKTEVEDAQQAAFDAARQNGVDPALIDKATAAWKQQGALSDLSNSIRQSVTGMRPELATPGAKASAEAVNAKQFFQKANRLYDSGRLQQAVGAERAEALLQHVDSAYLAAQKIANRNKVLKWVAGVTGVGGAAEAADKGLHYLLGQ